MPKTMTSARANWLRMKLGLSFEDVAAGMNRLAGTAYDRNDAYRWMSDKSRRGPSVTLVLFLRVCLKEAWHNRRAVKNLPEARADDLTARVKRFAQLASPDVLTRFQKRLVLSEFDLSEEMRRRTASR